MYLRIELAKPDAPEPRMEQPPFPGVLLRLGKGQIRVSAPRRASTHTGATDEGSCRPGANMSITVGQNAAAAQLISAPGRPAHQRNDEPLAVLAKVRPSRS